MDRIKNIFYQFVKILANIGIEIIFILIIFILIFHILAYLIRDRKYIRDRKNYKDSQEVNIQDLKDLPLVNIIIPAWNEGKSFENCLLSIKELYYPNLKIKEQRYYCFLLSQLVAKVI